MASRDGASGGALRGHAVAFALVAIFAGVALAVAYAASDGAIFGLGSSSPAGGLPVNDSSTGGAVVISRDSFDAAESVPAQPDPDVAPEPGTTLTEEQRQLLAMRDFPWDSVAGDHITSSQDSMDRFRPVEPGVEPLALSDRVLVSVERDRDRVAEDLEIGDIIDTDIIDDVIDVEIPINLDDEEQPEDNEQEEPQDDQNDGSDGGNQTGDDAEDDSSSGEGSGEEGSDDDQSGSDGDGGNSTSSGPSENSGSGDGNSTSTDSSGDG